MRLLHLVALMISSVMTVAAQTPRFIREDFSGGISTELVKISD